MQTFQDKQTVLDKQQRILAAQETAIHKIQEGFDEYKNGDLDRKAEIKKDLLIELFTSYKSRY